MKRKVMPEELPEYQELRPCRIIHYVPEWKRRELERDRSCGTAVERGKASTSGEGTVERPVYPPKETAAPDHGDAYSMADNELGVVLREVRDVLGEDEGTLPEHLR